MPLIDARTLPADHALDADFCVIGAGPAGLILARALAGEGRQIALMESGGPGPDPRTQALAEGAIAGDPMAPLHELRWRQLGGTAHLWSLMVPGRGLGFRSGTLDELDFEERPWVPDSGWPFSRAELDPWYRLAHKACEMGLYEYGPTAWETPDSPQLFREQRALVSSVWHCGPQDQFTDRLPAEVAATSGVVVYYHANLVALHTGDRPDRVRRAAFACLDGPRFTVSARHFVLAAGGIENPRLLLLSDPGRPGGAANRYDLVGRYFMEHQFFRAGSLYPTDPHMVERAGLYDIVRRGRTDVMGRFGLSPAVLRRERLLNVSAMLLPRHRRYRPGALESFHALGESLRRGRLPAHAAEHLKHVFAGLDFVALSAARKLTGRRNLMAHIAAGPGVAADGGWSELPDRGIRYSAFDVYLHTEQAPVRENRVELADERDELGCRRARLVWRWDDQSRDSAIRAQEVLGRQFDRARIGRFTDDLLGGRPRFFASGVHHHMGTTRMHSNPSLGVVDPHCRVHGMENLHIAGSSVFPTGGHVNPTLTIVALALRLGERLQLTASTVPPT